MTTASPTRSSRARVQCRAAALGDAVADRRRHRDHRAGHQAGSTLKSAPSIARDGDHDAMPRMSSRRSMSRHSPATPTSAAASPPRRRTPASRLRARRAGPRCPRNDRDPAGAARAGSPPRIAVRVAAAQSSASRAGAAERLKLRGAEAGQQQPLPEPSDARRSRRLRCGLGSQSTASLVLVASGSAASQTRSSVIGERCRNAGPWCRRRRNDAACRRRRQARCAARPRRPWCRTPPRADHDALARHRQRRTLVPRCAASRVSNASMNVRSSATAAIPFRPAREQQGGAGSRSRSSRPRLAASV